MTRRVEDARIAQEIADLDRYTKEGTSHRLVMMALGARTALEWVRDSKRADPMNPLRAISLLEWGLELPKVLPFKKDA